MTAPWTIRPGKPQESSDIAILADSAARRMASAFWAVDALPGQSWIEIGRTRILSNEAANLYHANWQVYEVDGHLAAGYCGFSIPDPYVPDRVPDVPDFFVPLLEMEQTAQGCWMLQCIAVFPEFRGRGIGRLLLDHACETARSTGAPRIVLEVETPNTNAIQLYRSAGFIEWERRPFVPFPGTDDSGDWILMAKDL